MARRATTYLELIDRHRRGQTESAAAPRATSKAKRKELQRDLAKHYEKCVAKNAGRFPSKRRLKSYCGVAWTIAKGHPRYRDYPGAKTMRLMPRRDPRTGRFLRPGSREASRPRGHYRKRSGRVVYVREAPASKKTPRKSAKRAAPRSKPRKGYNRHDPRTGHIVHVSPHTVHKYRRPRGQELYSPMYSPRRRRRHGTARAPVMMGAAGLSLFVTAAVFSDVLADVLHRLVSTKAANTDIKTLPAAYQVDGGVQLYNNDIVDAPPGWASIGVQVLLALVGFGGGALVKGAAWKFILYGVGTGSTLHLGTQLVSGYLLAPMTKNTSFGQINYQRELAVQANMAAKAGTSYSPIYMVPAGSTNAYAPAPAGTSSGPRNIVRRAGAPAALPDAQPSTRVPVALASLIPDQRAPATAGAPAAQPAPAARPAPAAAPAPAAEPAPAPAQEPFFHPMWTALMDRDAA